MFAGSCLLLPIYELFTLVPKPGGRRDMRSEEASLLRGSRCWGGRAARRSGDRQWLPEAVVLERWKIRWDGRLAAVLRGQGGVAAVREGAEESAPFARRPEPAAVRHVGGGAGNGDSLPAALKLEEPSPSARRRSVEPSTKGCPVPSHGTASESLSAGWGPSGSVSGNRDEIYFIFFFFPLSSLSLLILPSPFLSPRLSLPPGTHAAVIGSPQRGGGGE